MTRDQTAKEELQSAVKCLKLSKGATDVQLARTTVGWAGAALVVVTFGALAAARAQQGQTGPPPAVGVLEAVKRPITESNEFLGRIEAVNRVAVVARVTAFLDKRNFVEGSEVKSGDLLYRLGG